MLGSSSIARLNPKEFIPCQFWLNRGIGQATISDINMYITISPIMITPTKILLYAGENDASTELPVNKIINEYRNLLKNIQQIYPDSELHILAIKPSPARKQYWMKFKAVNHSMSKYIKTLPKVTFHKSNWEVTTDNQFLDDGIHLTKHGYITFTSGIKELCKNN